MSLYIITDWLGLVPICFIMGFGILGLCEWIKRKNIAYIKCGSGIFVYYKLATLCRNFPVHIPHNKGVNAYKMAMTRKVSPM